MSRDTSDYDAFDQDIIVQDVLVLSRIVCEFLSREKKIIYIIILYIYIRQCNVRMTQVLYILNIWSFGQECF